MFNVHISQDEHKVACKYGKCNRYRQPQLASVGFCSRYRDPMLDTVFRVATGLRLLLFSFFVLRKKGSKTKKRIGLASDDVKNLATRGNGQNWF